MSVALKERAALGLLVSFRSIPLPLLFCATLSVCACPPTLHLPHGAMAVGIAAAHAAALHAMCIPSAPSYNMCLHLLSSWPAPSCPAEWRFVVEGGAAGASFASLPSSLLGQFDFED